MTVVDRRYNVNAGNRGGVGRSRRGPEESEREILKRCGPMHGVRCRFDGENSGKVVKTIGRLYRR